MAPVTLTLQPEFAYVVATIAASFLLNVFLGIRVGMARKKYNCSPPNMYLPKGAKGADEFNQVQRGHQNMLETNAETYVCLILVGLFHPILASGCGAAYVVGRLIYAIGYAIAPSYRGLGEVLYLPAWIGLLYGMFSVATTLLA